MADQTIWRQWLHTMFDLVIATVVGTVAWQEHSASPWDFPIGLAMAIALVLRRYFPTSVFAVVAALAAAQVFLSDHVPTGYDMAVLIAMVAVVSHAEPIRWAYLAGGVVAAGVVIAALDRGTLFDSESFWDNSGENLTIVAGCAAIWLTAYVLRTRLIYVQSLEERAATAERERDHRTKLAAADERAGIARELHDVVAHSLAVMIVQADGASYAIDGDTDKARDAMRTIATTGRDALEDMRRIVEVLRGTSVAEEDGDRRRIGVDGLEALVGGARSAGLTVDLRIDGQPQGLSAADELTIYRLTQEGLTNALQHAGPGAQVTVALEFRDGVAVVEVIDDGGGRLSAAGPPDPRPAGGNGLIGMRERVAVHGGDFAAGPRLDAGWQVRATVPVKVAS